MASNIVTKEIESRLKQTPEHIFEVFLEINQPINNETPEILIKYPDDFTDQILKTAPNFAYPYAIPPDDLNENFTFVVLDSNATTFRFGYCRRSNRESTCLCLISYYPWFDVFYHILNDLAQLINSQSENEVEKFLTSLYNHKLMSVDGEELIEVNSTHQYSRPDLRRLPSILSDLNYTFLFSQFQTDLILRLFAHLIFERRILLISSKLFNLTACACACLHLINPMHWQSLFLPILPQSMTWTTQCTAPYIIGIHSSIYSQLNRQELGDVVIVDIDQRTIQSPYDDWHLFPEEFMRQMKRDIQQSSDDRIARIFLRTMALIVGNYANGFVMKNDRLDFDRSVYLEEYCGSDLYRFISTVVNTQMFEQFSRYRTARQLEKDADPDEFDIEVDHLQKNKRLKMSRKPVNIQEKKKTPLIEQIQHKAEKLHTAIQKTGQKVVQEMTQNLNQISINDSKKSTQTKSLIDIDLDEDPMLPAPVLARPLIAKLSTDDCKPLNPRDESSDQQEAIQQFDPLGNSTSVFYPSPFHENIQPDHANNLRQHSSPNPSLSSSRTNE